MTARIAENLIGSLDGFRREFWQRHPMYRSPSDAGSARKLFTLRDADMMLERQDSRPPNIGLMRSGQQLRESTWTHKAPSRSVHVPDAVDSQAVSREFAHGASIVFSNIDDTSQQIRSACADLQDAFLAPTRATAMVTPPHHREWSPRFDAFEAFIVQTEGSARWSVYRQADPLPLAAGSTATGRSLELALEVTLHPGDCLYIPWGSPHHVTSGQAISCHVTFRCQPVSWPTLLRSLMKASIPTAAYDAVPILAHLDGESLAGALMSHIAATGREIRTRGGEHVALYLDDLAHYYAPSAGFVQQAALRARMNADTRLRLNARVRYSLTRDGDRLYLKLSNREMRLSANFESAIQAIETSGELSMSDLRLLIGDKAAIALAGQLVENGILQIVPSS